MITWLFLALAVVTEVLGTLALRMAATGDRRWYAVTGVGYVAAFGSLSVVLGRGMGAGIAYGIWSATGVVLTALASRWLLKENITRTMAAGMALVVLGVPLIETGTPH